MHMRVPCPKHCLFVRSDWILFYSIFFTLLSPASHARGAFAMVILPSFFTNAACGYFFASLKTFTKMSFISRPHWSFLTRFLYVRLIVTMSGSASLFALLYFAEKVQPLGQLTLLGVAILT